MSAISSESEIAIKETIENAIKDYHASILPFLGARPLITGGDTPIGKPDFFDDVDAPPGWVKADGSVLNIADYPFLASHYEQVHGSKNFYGGNGTTTFAVPDLQGEFLRGSGINSHTNQGSGANVGVHQDATEVPFIIYNPSGGYNYINVNNSDPNSIKNADATIKGSRDGYYRTSVTSGASSNEQLRSSVRPTNTSFLICIKAVPAGMIFSENEQYYGKWIDGSDVWWKTVDCGAFPNNDAKTIPLNISNLDRIIYMYGAGSSNDGTYQSPLPYVHSNGNSAVILDYRNGNLYMSSASDKSNVTSSYVTVFYTKTS